MRKSTVFISAVLTTFALVMLYGVVSAYRNISNVPEATVLTIDTATAEPTTALTATSSIIMPEEAAQLAVQVVGNSNLLSAESSNINGVDAYKITFTNNDVVYVGLDGQILGVEIAPVVVNVIQPVKFKDNNNSGGSHDDHEDVEDHEEHEDEDD